MRDDDHSLGTLGERLEHPCRRDSVQPLGRLVEHHDRPLGEQRPRHAEARALTARESERGTAQFTREARRFQQRRQPDRLEGLEEFVAGGRLLGAEAAFPFNTSGGNIGEAYIHGFEMINESVRQIRGDSTCQVAKVERALVVAGPGYAPGSAVLFGVPA